MTGYMAMGRVKSGRVRAISRAAGPGRGPGLVAEPAVTDTGQAHVPAATPRLTLRDRWDALREEMGIMTFFLLDPESWR